MLWVVSYDIAADKRRNKVFKLLEGYGKHAQFSVFECDIDDTKRAVLEKRLRREIDPDEDDVRFYPLNAADLARVVVIGRGEVHQQKGHEIV